MIPARPTTYKGIRMRSRLEARYAALFDQWGLTWEYEPQAYANEAGQYLPDFLLRSVPFTRHGIHELQDVFVDAKPLSNTAVSTLRRMEIILASEPGALLVVSWPNDVADLFGRAYHRGCILDLALYAKRCDQCDQVGFFDEWVECPSCFLTKHDSP